MFFAEEKSDNDKSTELTKASKKSNSKELLSWKINYCAFHRSNITF